MEVYETFLADAERIGIAKSSKLGFANGMLFSSAFFIYGRRPRCFRRFFKET
jgi:hypothetical protein